VDVLDACRWVCWGQETNIIVCVAYEQWANSISIGLTTTRTKSHSHTSISVALDMQFEVRSTKPYQINIPTHDIDLT